jgi:hypothetical protein
MKERNAMAIESNGYEVVPTYNESYYEELASVEEIYLEETEEELRSKLISDTTEDDRPTPAPYSIRISIERHSKSISGMRITADVASTRSGAHGHIL